MIDRLSALVAGGALQAPDTGLPEIAISQVFLFERRRPLAYDGHCGSSVGEAHDLRTTQYRSLAVADLLVNFAHNARSAESKEENIGITPALRGSFGRFFDESMDAKPARVAFWPSLKCESVNLKVSVHAVTARAKLRSTSG